MNIALIFAGGTGHRMNSRSKPKQFLELHGKPIIIYTLEHFEYHEEIDSIVIVCLSDWIEELQGLIKRYNISKTKSIVPGGPTGHESIYNGLKEIQNFATDNDLVLIHDGVRPLINKELISENISTALNHGNAITAEQARESIVRSTDGNTITESIPLRSEMYIAKAPQTFHFNEIFNLYIKAEQEQKICVDSSHLCSIYNIPMFMVKSNAGNIKITEPIDYYIYRAVCEAIENQQLFGL